MKKSFRKINIPNAALFEKLPYDSPLPKMLPSCGGHLTLEFDKNTNQWLGTVSFVQEELDRFNIDVKYFYYDETFNFYMYSIVLDAKDITKEEEVLWHAQ